MNPHPLSASQNLSFGAPTVNMASRKRQIGPVRSSSAVEEFAARPRPRHCLERDELDLLLALNRDWIVPEPRNPTLKIKEYIQLHDPPLQPLLGRLFLELDIKIVPQFDFLDNFYDCVNEFLALMRSTASDATVYIMGGREFGKSNMWLLLLFWQHVRTHFPFRIRVISENTTHLLSLKKSDMLLFIDDCAYSGLQISKQLSATHKNTIICPYVSNIAQRLFEQKRREGCDITLIMRIAPSSTERASDLVLRAPHKTTSLFDLLEIDKASPRVTWIFDHKIADTQSVPQPLFGLTPTVQINGPVDFQQGETQGTIHIASAPSKPTFPLVHPCRATAYSPCYTAQYMENAYVVTPELIRRIFKVFLQIHPEARVNVIE